MSEFALSDEIDKEKCFILNRSEIDKRLDTFYYKPSIKRLEEKVNSKGAVPLRLFIQNISSGATPKTSDKEKYYSDKENGIAFLRVQNLSHTGFLKLNNCKYINKETHHNYLKRSKVKGGDLLVKITGVGRMAVASVAPDGFVGNTNQHMVVIKTKDRQTSEILASYLNTDIGEMLASRRATGGTRPALDYPALLSIPIIFDNKILEIYKKAIESKKQKEKQAKDLLDSIDDYLLDELGIILPKIDNSLDKRIFEVNLSDVSGGRFDSEFYQIKYKQYYDNLNLSKYEILNIKDITIFIGSGATPRAGGNDYKLNGNIYFLRLTNFNDNLEINFKKSLYIKSNIHNNMLNRSKLKNGDILFGIAGSIGKIAIFNKDVDANINQAIAILRFKQNINNLYIAYLLNSSILKYQINQHQRPVAQPNMNINELKSLKIPLPPIKKQNEIATHITSIRAKAKKLKTEAMQDLENAKLEVEKMILGE